MQTKDYKSTLCDVKSNIIKLKWCPANESSDSEQSGLWAQCLQTISSLVSAFRLQQMCLLLAFGANGGTMHHSK